MLVVLILRDCWIVIELKRGKGSCGLIQWSICWWLFSTVYFMPEWVFIYGNWY